MINERHSKEPSSSISTKGIQNSSFISDLLGCEYFVSNNVGCNNLWKKWNSVWRIILFCDNKTCLKQVSKSKGLFPHTQSLFYKVFLRTHFLPNVYLSTILQNSLSMAPALERVAFHGSPSLYPVSVWTTKTSNDYIAGNVSF